MGRGDSTKMLVCLPLRMASQAWSLALALSLSTFGIVRPDRGLEQGTKPVEPYPHVLESRSPHGVPRGPGKAR